MNISIDRDRPLVLFVPLSGFRVKEQQLLEWGMTLPGLQSRAKAIGELPALGLLTLAGASPEPWQCVYRSAPSISEDFADRLAAEKPTLVAISALTASILEAYELADMLRTRHIPTVMGGLHVTALPDEAQSHCDAVVIGHGEAIWPQVLSDALEGRLARRYDATQMKLTWPAPRIDLLGKHPPRYTLQTQTGCPLACDFCGASRILGRFREKPLNAIRRDLDAICRASPRPLLELADDNTFSRQNETRELLDLLKRSGARWFTESDWRIGEQPEILSELSQSGCKQILVGIESLVFRYPGQGEKHAELERIMNAVQAIQNAGVVVNGCFIVGADGETHDSIDRLAEFLAKSPFAEVQVTLQTPFPGAGLYRRLKSENRLIPGRDWSYYTLFDVTYQPDCMSVDQLEVGFRRLVSQVYSKEETNRREAIRREVWRKGRGPSS